MTSRLLAMISPRVWGIVAHIYVQSHILLLLTVISNGILPHNNLGPIGGIWDQTL